MRQHERRLVGLVALALVSLLSLSASAKAATTTGAVTTDTMATGRADGRERLRPMLSLRSDIGCRRPGPMRTSD